MRIFICGSWGWWGIAITVWLNLIGCSCKGIRLVECGLASTSGRIVVILVVDYFLFVPNSHPSLSMLSSHVHRCIQHSSPTHSTQLSISAIPLLNNPQHIYSTANPHIDLLNIAWNSHSSPIVTLWIPWFVLVFAMSFIPFLSFLLVKMGDACFFVWGEFGDAFISPVIGCRCVWTSVRWRCRMSYRMVGTGVAAIGWGTNDAD